MSLMGVLLLLLLLLYLSQLLWMSRWGTARALTLSRGCCSCTFLNGMLLEAW
jgi:hypothetical protein